MTLSQRIIEIFENYLEEKGIDIPNEDRDRDGNPDAAIIYGCDYGDLETQLDELLKRELLGKIEG